MKSIHPQIHIISILGSINFYLIQGKDGVAVIDTGIGKGTVSNLRRNLPTLGLKLEDVRHILITHAHFDHVGGLKALHEALPEARIYASEIDAKIISGEVKLTYAPRSELRGIPWLMSFMLARQTKPVKVDSFLDEHTDLDFLLSGLKVIALPGHSYGQIGFYLPSANLLIGADVMMGKIPLFGLTMPFRAASVDWKQCAESIRKVSGLNLHTLALGHGAPLIGDAAAQVNALAAKIKQRGA